jgi:hypothetical protein
VCEPNHCLWGHSPEPHALACATSRISWMLLRARARHGIPAHGSLRDLTTCVWSLTPQIRAGFSLRDLTNFVDVP